MNQCVNTIIILLYYSFSRNKITSFILDYLFHTVLSQESKFCSPIFSDSSFSYRYEQVAKPTFLEKEREQMTRELIELRSALSDVNVFIHAERQQVVRLHAENERLKVLCNFCFYFVLLSVRRIS